MSEHDDHIPADLTPAHEETIREERARMFTLGFWKSLLMGREGLGDTFWAGNYLAALFMLPVTLLLFTIGSFAPSLFFLLPASHMAFGIYLLFVARAVAVAKPVSQVGWGWRITAVVWTLMDAASVMAYQYLKSGL